MNIIPIFELRNFGFKNNRLFETPGSLDSEVRYTLFCNFAPLGEMLLGERGRGCCIDILP